MIYELRVYHMLPGRMAAIHKRFSEVTLDLFKKHHLHVIDFWEDIDGNERIYYIIEHKDRQSAEANFASFRNDPEWIAAAKKSEEDGKIVEKVESFFMKRVPYSPVND